MRGESPLHRRLTRGSRGHAEQRRRALLAWSPRAPEPRRRAKDRFMAVPSQRRTSALGRSTTVDTRPKADVNDRRLSEGAYANPYKNP